MEAVRAPSCGRSLSQSQGIVLASKPENSEVWRPRPSVGIYQVSLDMKVLMILSRKPEGPAQVLRAAGMLQAEVLPCF